MRNPLVSILTFALFAATANAEDWPQFRGPGGRAVSETAVPPVGFGPSSNLVWKVATTGGYSSPIVAGERVFLTSAKEGKLQVFCIDRTDGRVLWRKEISRE